MSDNEAMAKQLESFEKLLETASRTEAKELNREITLLKKERTAFTKEIDSIHKSIEYSQGKIDKFNEQLWKISLKPSMVGEDSDKNEYWFFKEDLGKLYVKEKETGDWKMYDDEESVVTLEASLTSKGL